jgi:predicted dehydrogenase
MSNCAEPLGIGIIGCGNVLDAYLRLADKLQAERLARVVAACGRSHQRSLIADRLPDAAFYAEGKELIASPAVNVVVILTSMSSHAALASSALAAGKHVLVEKPLATSLQEASALMDASQRSGCQLICAPFTCLSPTFRAIGRHLARGDVGTVVLARGRYGWAGPDWSEWFYKGGGGAVFDLAVYNLTTLTGWLGPAKRVGAMLGTAIPFREINGKSVAVESEDNAQILLDFGDARLAVVTSGFTIQQYRGPAIELYGKEGTIQLLGDDWNPQGYEMWRNSASCWQCYNESRPDWPWTDGLRHLIECVREGQPTTLRLEHAMHVLEIMLCTRQASNDGCFVELQSRFEPYEFDQLEERGSAHRIHDRTRL